MTIQIPSRQPPAPQPIPAPLTLEYQSRIIKAKRLAVGGLSLLDGGIAGVMAQAEVKPRKQCTVILSGEWWRR